MKTPVVHDDKMKEVIQHPHGRVLLPRVHFYEINDQSWFPPILREKVQDVLTIGWINRFPIIQSIAPCALAAHTLHTLLGSSVSDYIYIDFASGSGGPIPYIEHSLNTQLLATTKPPVQFVMSDISPNIKAWTAASKKSENISFVPKSVDATCAPPTRELVRGVPGAKGKKVMRLFNLAFHHFDDELAGRVLRNTVETADGFCIFELQSRHLSSFILVSLLWPLAMLVSPYYFSSSPLHLLFTYLIPIVPFVWVFDGYISCLRTRTPDEVEALMKGVVDEQVLGQWEVRSGRSCFMWPVGYLYWIVAVNREEGKRGGA